MKFFKFDEDDDIVRDNLDKKNYEYETLVKEEYMKEEKKNKKKNWKYNKNDKGFGT